MTFIDLRGNFIDFRDAAIILRRIANLIEDEEVEGIFREDDNKHCIAWELKDDDHGAFEVLNLCRDDIVTEFTEDNSNIGSVKEMEKICNLITNEELGQVAKKVGEYLTDNDSFWTALHSVVEEMELIKKYKAECPSDEFVNGLVCSVFGEENPWKILKIPGVKEAIAKEFEKTFKEGWKGRLKAEEEN